MKTSVISYTDQGHPLEAFVAHPSQEKRPLVVLCHAWRGRDPFICEKAEELAQWGYVGFALDMYGKGILGNSAAENAALKKPFLQDRALLLRRALKGVATAQALPYVDATRIAVVGFGFGGLCALDLARSGASLRGAVSLYGHFDALPKSLERPVQAKVLLLHGYEDSVVNQAELHAFEKQLNDAGVDWQAHVYGGAKHAFATPGSNNPEAGILYHPVAARRAWMAVRSFLEEIL